METRLRVGVPAFDGEPQPDGSVIPRVPDGKHAIESGNPNLPFLLRMIPVPRNCVAQIEITRLIHVETNSPPITPVPTRELQETEDGRRSVKETLIPRGPGFERNGFWPVEPLEISYAAQGTQRWARIVFHPLQYNPVQGMLRWNKSIEARLVWNEQKLGSE
ncbi:MAG TPA: C25 family peptidase propeptide domain-containing protein [Kiritimatiellia bacterium]|nr:C25 family peptidase propeptide domain-containing protein [Kiritimatiellia bacterium]